MITYQQIGNCSKCYKLANKMGPHIHGLIVPHKQSFKTTPKSFIATSVPCYDVEIVSKVLWVIPDRAYEISIFGFGVLVFRYIIYISINLFGRLNAVHRVNPPNEFEIVHLYKSFW